MVKGDLERLRRTVKHGDGLDEQGQWSRLVESLTDAALRAEIIHGVSVYDAREAGLGTDETGSFCLVLAFPFDTPLDASPALRLRNGDWAVRHPWRGTFQVPAREWAAMRARYLLKEGKCEP